DVVDQLFASLSPGGVATWELTDRLGSVRQVTDSKGSVIDTITYDGFGNITNETNAANGGRYKRTGREGESETEMQDNRATDYDPKTGRWTSQDQLGFGAGDSNLYRYISNRNMNNVDPSGFQTNSIFGQSTGKNNPFLRPDPFQQMFRPDAFLQLFQPGGMQK